MRYRLPEGCVGVTCAGIELDKAADGTVDAEESDALLLAPHGIVPVDAEEPAAEATPVRVNAGDRRMPR